jgi:hypothetical protein
MIQETATPMVVPTHYYTRNPDARNTMKLQGMNRLDPITSRSVQSLANRNVWIQLDKRLVSREISRSLAPRGRC